MFAYCQMAMENLLSNWECSLIKVILDLESVLGDIQCSSKMASLKKLLSNLKNQVIHSKYQMPRRY